MNLEFTFHSHFAAPLICIENSQLFLGSAVIVNGFVSPYQFANVVDRGARGLQRADKMLYESHLSRRAIERYLKENARLCRAFVLVASEDTG